MVIWLAKNKLSNRIRRDYVARDITLNIHKVFVMSLAILFFLIIFAPSKKNFIFEIDTKAVTNSN